MHNFPSQYQQNNGVFSPVIDDQVNPIAFDYSDGEEFEHSIKEIIASASDKSLFSAELRQAIWDWRSSCHLSPVRANILRPLEAICRGRVLELGSGCGIITRYLGELGSDVVALEASPFRAGVTRLRTEDLQNVKVVCDRIEDFDSEEKFDVVTMIGVLQYARIFSNCGEKAELRFIENAARQLDTDGVLVIAIQNKLSLKSLSGYPEPNVGQPYFGIENRYGEETIIRFGLDEIKSILSSAGLTHHAVLFPFPDYHMPVTILNEKAIKFAGPFSAESLLTASVAKDRARPEWSSPQFSLECGWNTVHSCGATAYLSNAFLIIAGKTDKSVTFHREMKEYAWHYSSDRHPAFATQKRFISEGKDVVVTRSPLYAKQAPSVPITQNMFDGPYVKGTLWWEFLVVIVNRPGWTVADVAMWVKPWLDAIHPNNGQGLCNLDELLSGKFFDYTPFNCVKAIDGSLHFIDHEWETHSSLEFSYLVLRGLFGSLHGLSSCAQPTKGTPRLIVDLIKSVLGVLNLNVTNEHIDQYVLKEASIQSWVTGGEASEPDLKLRDYIFSITLDYRVSDAELKSNLANTVARLQSVEDEFKTTLENTDVRLKIAEAELVSMKLSASWRITALGRYLRKLSNRFRSKF